MCSSDLVAQVSQRSNLAAGLPKLAAAIGRQTAVRPEFYIELGQGWLGVRKPTNAIAAFQEAVKREPDSPVAVLNLADALTEAGQPDRAMPLLQRALLKTDGEPLLCYQLGIAASAAGKDTEAMAAFGKCIALDPEFAEPRNLLAGVLAATGDLEIGRASGRERV